MQTYSGLGCGPGQLTIVFGFYVFGRILSWSRPTRACNRQKATILSKLVTPIILSITDNPGPDKAR